MKKQKKDLIKTIALFCGICVVIVGGWYHWYKQSMISDYVAQARYSCIKAAEYSNMLWAEREIYCDCVLHKALSDLSLSELQDIKVGFISNYSAEKFLYKSQKYIGRCLRKAKDY